MDRVLVDDEGTGRRMLEEEGFSLRVRGVDSAETTLFMEYERLCILERLEKPRAGVGGASPNMKNLIKAPIRRTTESWPTRRP